MRRQLKSAVETAHSMDWCRERDSNPHWGMPKRFLRPPRLPFRHPGAGQKIPARPFEGAVRWVRIVAAGGRPGVPGRPWVGGSGDDPAATRKRSP